jgi:hypothetical protein
MRMHRELRGDQQPSQTDYNALVRSVNMLMNMRGDGGITVHNHPNGVTIQGSGATSSRPRNAFPIDDAPAGSSITCFIDTDSAVGVVPGPRVVVECEVVGGSNLNAAITRLEDGSRLTIWDNNGTWRPFYPFQATKDC